MKWHLAVHVVETSFNRDSGIFKAHGTAGVSVKKMWVFHIGRVQAVSHAEHS